MILILTKKINFIKINNNSIFISKIKFNKIIKTKFNKIVIILKQTIIPT
jgi:hypothetical protein